MNERLKQLRRALGLTQQEFAKRIGMKQNTVATYEMGRGHPSGRAVRYICNVFHVREEWLLTGEGEMFQSLDRDGEIAAFVGRVLGDGEQEFPRRVLLALSRLTPEEWAALEKLHQQL